VLTVVPEVIVSADEDAEPVAVGTGMPRGTLLVYDRRRGNGVALCGLELSTSAELEAAPYSGFG